jgi:hypothetical protein
MNRGDEIPVPPRDLDSNPGAAPALAFEIDTDLTAIDGADVLRTSYAVSNDAPNGRNGHGLVFRGTVCVRWQTNESKVDRAPDEL